MYWKFPLIILSFSALTSSVLAADMIEYVEPAVAPIPADKINWDGSYLGAHIGYGHSHINFYDLDECFDLHNNMMKFSDKGFIAGVHAGHNWTSGQFLYGIEGDLTWMNLKDSGTIIGPPDVNISTDMKFHGTARLRAGMIMDNFLVYATGGLAVASIDYKMETLGGTTSYDYSDNAIKAGWAVGGGVEVMMTEKTSLKLEYMHSEFSKSSFYLPLPADGNFKFDDNKVDTVKIGISFRL